MRGEDMGEQARQGEVRAGGGKGRAGKGRGG